MRKPFSSQFINEHSRVTHVPIVTIRNACLHFVLLLGFFSTISQLSFAQGEKLAITNVTVFPGPGQLPISNATILIKDGKLEKIAASQKLKPGKDYRVIDGNGKFATAGFWNSHVHLIEPAWSNAANMPVSKLEKQLQEMLGKWGFAYAFDLAQFDFDNLNIIRKRIESNEVKGPWIYAVGAPFTSKNPFYVPPGSLPELKTNAQVTAHIRLQFEKAADGVKLWSASPIGGGVDFMADSLISTAALAAKEHAVPLFAHPTNLAGVQKAVKNGVNILAHTAPDDLKVWDSNMIRDLLDHNVALIPTLKLFPWELQKEGVPATHPMVTTAIGQLSAFQKAGGRILFGTDVGYMTDYNPLEEYKMMQKAGLSFHQILAALTTNPAEQFGYGSRKGKLTENYEADIVLLNSDPSKDVAAFCDVATVIRAGTIIYNK